MIKDWQKISLVVLFMLGVFACNYSSEVGTKHYNYADSLKDSIKLDSIVYINK